MSRILSLRLIHAMHAVTSIVTMHTKYFVVEACPYFIYESTASCQERHLYY